MDSGSVTVLGMKLRALASVVKAVAWEVVGLRVSCRRGPRQLFPERGLWAGPRRCVRLVLRVLCASGRRAWAGPRLNVSWVVVERVVLAACVGRLWASPRHGCHISVVGRLWAGPS